MHSRTTDYCSVNLPDFLWIC